MASATRATAGNGKHPKPHTQAELRAAASELLTRLQFAANAGLTTFGGLRDTYTTLGYEKKLEPKHYRARYERGGIAERIVEALPKATWRGGGQLIEDEDPDVLTPFEEAFGAIVDRLYVWPTLLRADILAGLGRYAVVLIGAPGALSTELPKGQGKPDKLLYLQPYAEDCATIDDGDREKDTASPRYGLPNLYKLKLAVANGVRDEKVHWTRILHVVEGQLETELFGKPRLRAVWNYLDDLEKVHGAGAEAFWLRANPGLQLDLDPELQWDATAEADLEDEVEQYQHGIRRLIRTRGAKLNQLAMSVASIASNVDSLLMLISATTGIPHRILTGSERGELASSQDKNNWDQRVQDRRDSFAAPAVVRPLVDRLVDYNYLPKPTEYRVEWPQIDNLEDTERATIAAQMAEVNAKAGTTVYIADEIRAVTGHPVLAEVEGADELLEREREEDEVDVEDDEDAQDLLAASAQEPEWKAIHRAADRHRAGMQRAVVASFAVAGRALNLSGLEGAFSLRSHESAQELAERAIEAGEAELGETLPPRLLAALVAGGRAAVKPARARVLRAAATQLELSFDASNPLAEEWARLHAASLIVEVGLETRAAIRELIANAIAQGIAPREAARQVYELVGLNSQQATAVQNLARELMEAEPGSLVTRAGGKFKVRIPVRGASLEFIRARVAKYAERMHRLRALNISRSETLAAANEGARQLWVQGRDAGLIDPALQKVWIATNDERTCPICSALDGEQVGIEENFSAGVLGPPSHTSCRCSHALAEPKAQSHKAAA